jgi:hypothetical protein
MRRSASKPQAGNYQNLTSAPILPNYLGLPFRILVSPFVNFDPEQRTTDAMMFNSRNLGALIVDQDPRVTNWDHRQACSPAAHAWSLLPVPPSSPRAHARQRPKLWVRVQVMHVEKTEGWSRDRSA